MKVQIINLSPNELPKYETQYSAGMDLRADFSRMTKDAINKNCYDGAEYDGINIIMPPMSRALIPTGIFIALPEGYEAQVRPRSGLAIKKGITIYNSPGTIN